MMICPTQRMGATTVEIKSSHVAMVYHPKEVTNLIETAAQAVKGTSQHVLKVSKPGMHMHSWPYDEFNLRAAISAWGFPGTARQGKCGPAEIVVLSTYDHSHRPG